MDNKLRQQLTLFVDKTDADNIESIRKKFNPDQYQLIASHVTLCREDELKNIILILNNLRQLDTSRITIRFGQIARFDNGFGVQLPALGDNEGFQQLRLKILTGLGMTVRRHKPHITIMHPRNSTCTDDIFKEIEKINFPTSLSFDTISLIEQVDGGQWHTLEKYKLNDHA